MLKVEALCCCYVLPGNSTYLLYVLIRLLVKSMEGITQYNHVLKIMNSVHKTITQCTYEVIDVH